MTNKSIATRRDTRRSAYDPFALARTFFGMDPFYDTRENKSRVTFMPSFEVKENDNGYILSADVPGLTEDELDIALHNNVLTVSGTRTAEERKEGETYYVYERQYGSFSRSFTLPDEANAEQIKAGMKDGVLTITVGKKAESKPRKIALGK